MNSDEVIRMAEEAGLVRFEGGELEAYGIAEASHDDHSRACWRIADEQRLKHFAALVAAASAAAEREACAKLFDGEVWAYDYREIANAIRARGQHGRS